MGISDVLDIFREGLIVALKVSAPILIVSMASGFIISVFQAATQIHEQTLTFVPKLILIGVVLVVCGGWMSETLMDYIKYIFEVVASKS